MPIKLPHNELFIPEKRLRGMAKELALNFSNFVNRLSPLVHRQVLDAGDVETLEQSLYEILQKLFLHATGYRTLPPKEVEEMVNNLAEFIWGVGLVPWGSVRWYTWQNTSELARLLRAALIRNKLLAHEDLQPYEVAIISGTTTGNISHHIRYGRLTTRTTPDGRLVIPYEEVIAYLGQEDHDIVGE